MISFLGKCVSNLFEAVKYICSGQMRLKHAIAQAAIISYDSLLISLTISFVAAAVITIQVSKQFLMSGADTYVGGYAEVFENILFNALNQTVMGGNL
jgi:ABC-type transporter Mla maintaining outer membrane lipid asymmetry permease subunit MlaE